MKTQHSNYLFLFLLVLMPFAGSCSSPSASSGKNILEEKLQKNLPSGWQMQVTEVDSPPFQWQGPLSKGYRVHFSNPGKKEQKLRPYAEKYPKEERMMTLIPQMIRYLYKDLDAGFSYSMFQRVHPAELEAVTKDYVIVRPSTVSSEVDHQVPADLKSSFQKILDYPTPDTQFQHEILSNDSPSLDIQKIKSQTTGKKAIVIRSSSQNNSKQFLKIITLVTQ